MTKIKKTIIALMLIFTLIGAPNHAHAAFVWGTLNITGDAFKQVLEEISIQIKEAIFAAAKIAAIKQATSTIEDSLYGDSSSPRNISDFKEFLVEDSQEEAITYAQDFLTNSLRGTTSSDYSSSGGGSGGLEDDIKSAGEAVIDRMKGETTATVDYADYCDGDDFFEGGDFECFGAIMTNPLNTPIGMAIATDEAAKRKYAEEKETAQLEATSSGVLGQKDDDGKTIIPSSVVGEIQLQQITLPLEALANGDNNAFSTMIQSFAVSLVTDIIERGLGEVEDSINQNTDAFERQFEDQLDDLTNSTGPSSEYSSDPYSSSQKAKPWVNPDTGQTMTGGTPTQDEDQQSVSGGIGGV